MKLENLLFDLQMAERETHGHREIFYLSDKEQEVHAALDLLPRVIEFLQQVKREGYGHGKACEKS